MAKFSRMKGRREEQQLVLALKALGYQAERILRQYQAAGQPDVKATKDGKTITLELKTRNRSFTKIYSTYHRDKYNDGILRFSHGGVAIAASTDLEMLATQAGAFEFPKLECLELFKPEQAVYERIIKMERLKQTADYLVIKDNREDRLYIRYWS